MSTKTSHSRDMIAVRSEEVLKSPGEWRRIRLGDVLKLRKDVVYPRDNPQGRATFVGLEHIESQTGRRVASVEQELSRLTGRKPQFRTQDIVYGYLRPYLNKVWIAEFDGLCSVDQYVYEVNRNVADVEYVAWFMRSPTYLRRAPIDQTPGQLPRIRTDEVASVELDLPPLAEQRRIAGRIREEIADVTTVRAAVEAQLAASKVLPAALLRAVFFELRSKDCPRCRIGDVCALQSGYAFKSEWFASDGIRLLRNANVSQGRITWDDTARIPWDRRSDFSSFELKTGDIVLSLDRPLVGNGLKVARLTADDIPALLLQRVGRFQPNCRIAPEYLYQYLNSTDFIRAITGHDQSLGVPHVSPKQVEDVEVPLPPIDQQFAVASRLVSELSDATKLRQSLTDQLAALERVPAALLREAFGPSDPL